MKNRRYFLSGLLPTLLFIRYPTILKSFVATFEKTNPKGIFTVTFTINYPTKIDQIRAENTIKSFFKERSPAIVEVDPDLTKHIQNSTSYFFHNHQKQVVSFHSWLDYCLWEIKLANKRFFDSNKLINLGYKITTSFHS